jgi:hypothetical protein
MKNGLKKYGSSSALYGLSTRVDCGAVWLGFEYKNHPNGGNWAMYIGI